MVEQEIDRQGDLLDSHRHHIGKRLLVMWLWAMILEPPFRKYIVGPLPLLPNLALAALTYVLIYLALVAVGEPHRAFTRREWLLFWLLFAVTFAVVGAS